MSNEKQAPPATERAQMEDSMRWAALHSWMREATVSDLARAIVQMAKELDERQDPEPPF